MTNATAISALIENAGGHAAPAKKAIRAAAQATGVGFDYLVSTATRESSLNPSARAATSSASGLFQFTDSTWLHVMKDHGGSYGFQREAEAIRGTANGLAVDDPSMRQHIMGLRMDPDVNALMAGAFTKDNNNYLAETLSRQPTQGELYIAHFLGPKGAGDFIRQTMKTPIAAAADYFPRAASANRSIFYEDGRKRTLGEVYGALVASHQNATLETQKIASAAPPAPRAVVEKVSEDGALFRNLFTSRRPGGVSPVVTALWTRQSAPPVQEASLGPAVNRPFFPTGSNETY